MNELTIPAPAKINLALDVKGVRPDGYHDLEMIMQSIALHDLIYMKKVPQGIKISSNVEALPEDRSNLAYQAAEIILKESGLTGGIEIFIDKKIPIAAGLAGGSTDAAAVLKGINLLYDLKFDESSLVKMASKVGADVPFCLRGGTVYATDRGDKLEQLPDIKEEHLILITPSVKVSTARVYNEYDLLQPLMEIPILKLLRIIKSGKEINWEEGWGNVLELVTMRLVPDLLEIKNILHSFDVKFNLMSGSGPSIFAPLANPHRFRTIIDNWPRKDDYICLTRTIKQDFPE